jgi:hypothetical protein
MFLEESDMNNIPKSVLDELFWADQGKIIENYEVLEIETTAFPCGESCCGIEKYRWKLKTPDGEVIELTDPKESD